MYVVMSPLISYTQSKELAEKETASNKPEFDTSGPRRRSRPQDFDERLGMSRDVSDDVRTIGNGSR